WPLEWGENPKAPWLSLHTRQESLQKTLDSLPSLQASQKIKLAVPIANFAELERGWRWQQESPQQRAFLPMSQNGRWQWFRHVTSLKSPLNFCRMGQGSSLDQPTVSQICAGPDAWKSFAAVLGSPVKHSQTPT